MSLILGTTAAILALRRMKSSSSPGDSMYIKGTDVLGDQSAKAESKTATENTVVEVHTGTFWTSVAAGLTTVGVVTVLGYMYAKYQGKPHFLDGFTRGPQ